MKKTRLNLKLITLLLSSALLFQSCKVYEGKTVTVDEALQFPGRVKIKTINNDTYKFENLKKEEGQLYGIAKKKSKTSKDLLDKIINENSNNKYVKILLTEELVQEIHLQNKTISTILTVIGIGVVSIIVFTTVVLASW